MVRYVLASLASCLALIASGADAAAQSPSPDVVQTAPSSALSPPAGQRIEVPEAGLAVTFPDDWHVRVQMSGPGQIHEDLADPSVESWIVLVGTSADPAEGCALLQLRGADFAAFAERYPDWVASWPSWRGSVDVATVALPSGEALRVHVEDAADSPEGNAYVGSSAYSTAYALDGGRAVIWLTCRLDSLPGDDSGTIDSSWRGIAETIEILPVTAASELAWQFPAELQRLPLEVEAASGPDWVGRLDPADPEDARLIARAEAFVERLERSIDDMTIATAIHQPRRGAVSTVAAVRVDGVAATSMVKPILGFLAPELAEPVLQWQPGGGHWSIVARDASMPGLYPVTLVPVGDTIWVVQADRPLRDEVVAALPPQPPFREPLQLTDRVQVAEVGLTMSVPAGWEVAVDLEKADVPPVLHGSDARGWHVLSMREEDDGIEPLPDILSLRGGGDPDFCSLSLYAPTATTPATYFDALLGDQAPGVALEDHGDFLRLSAGPPSAFGADVFVDLYVIGDGASLAEMMCIGEMPPGDRWLPLAESVQLGPTAAVSRRTDLPEPGAPAPTTVVTLEVPNLRGLSLEDAEMVAAEFGLSVRALSVPIDGAEPGTVVDQEPSPGSAVDEGATVDLEIATAD